MKGYKDIEELYKISMLCRHMAAILLATAGKWFMINPLQIFAIVYVHRIVLSHLHYEYAKHGFSISIFYLILTIFKIYLKI